MPNNWTKHSDELATLGPDLDVPVDPTLAALQEARGRVIVLHDALDALDDIIDKCLETIRPETKPF